jgi:hypothetical protein
MIIMTEYILALSENFVIYKQFRIPLLKWLDVEEVKEEKKVIEKIDKFYRENDVDIYVDDEFEEEEIEEEISTRIGEKVDPKKVLICSKHKTPLEYCEFRQDWSDCRLEMISKCPELLEKITVAKEKDPVRKPVEKKKKK